MSTQYGIEWAYGEFHIARLRFGECVESWKSPTPVTDLRSLSIAMYEASLHIDLSGGGSVAIAFEDDLHTHRFLDVPKLRRKDTRKYLQRKVDQDKPFEGAGAWCYHTADHGRTEGVLLHLMPQYVVESVVRICEEFFLMPKRLVPLTEIMSERVPALGAASDEILLLIALFDARTQLVVSRGDGEVMFVRELSYSASDENLERLAIDVTRTLGYAKQRLDGVIRKAWLIGGDAERVSAKVAGQLDIEIEVDPLGTAPEFWMTEVAKLPQRLESNFIPSLARRSITGKAAMRTGVLLTGVTVLAALGLSATVEWLLAKHRLNIPAIEHEIALLDDDIGKLSDEIEHMALEKSKLSRLSADAFNLPAVFLSHLGTLVPEDLVLTSAELSRDTEFWTISLSGHADIRLDELAPVLTELERRLTAEPWNATITNSWRDAWLEQLRSGHAAQAAAVGFAIEGRLQ